MANSLSAPHTPPGLLAPYSTGAHAKRAVQDHLEANPMGRSKRLIILAAQLEVSENIEDRQFAQGVWQEAAYFGSADSLTQSAFDSMVKIARWMASADRRMQVHPLSSI